MLFPEMYRLNQLIKQLQFRRFSSTEKESVKNHAPFMYLLWFTIVKPHSNPLTCQVFPRNRPWHCYDFHCKYSMRCKKAWWTLYHKLKLSALPLCQTLLPNTAGRQSLLLLQIVPMDSPTSPGKPSSTNSWLYVECLHHGDIFSSMDW